MSSRLFAVLLAVLLLAPACATTPNQKAQGVVILLPDEEGKTGSIIVSGAGGERLLSKPRQSVTVAAGEPPGRPFTMSEKEVSSQVGPALEALPKPPIQFIFFFENDSSDLPKDALAQVRKVVQAIKERAPADVSVVGHTDTVGTRDYNKGLSLKRAREIAALLAAAGIDPKTLQITYHGKDNLLVPTGDQVPEPRNRRVEVTVR